jgi:hypothetical protein
VKTTSRRSEVLMLVTMKGLQYHSTFPQKDWHNESNRRFFETHINHKYCLRNPLFKLFVIFHWYDSPIIVLCTERLRIWVDKQAVKTTQYLAKKQLSLFSMRDKYGHDILVTSREENELGSLDLVWSKGHKFYHCQHRQKQTNKGQSYFTSRQVNLFPKPWEETQGCRANQKPWPSFRQGLL